jgi:23S rRNA (pseudouridine1915-N3)-methyltransferase
VKLVVAWIGRTKSAPLQCLTTEYLQRLSRFVPCDSRELPSEKALPKLAAKSVGRTPPHLVLLDSRGRQLSSEEIANFLQRHQSQGTQELLFAVGPPDGWSDATRAAARSILSLGKITLPHELARVVLLEQLYRGFTILNRHPYHAGH